MSDKTGGPAFPTSKVIAGGESIPVSGMSIRDYIAIKAMEALIIGCFSGNNSGFTVQGNVFASYEYADAMLAERAK